MIRPDTPPLSIPHVGKVGLVAPFEGLHRQTGYALLDHLRTALAECSNDVARLPLALDDSHRPENARRALAKIHVDPAVEWVLGPFAPVLLAAVAPHPKELDASLPPGLVPFLIHPEGRLATHVDWPAAMAHYLHTLNHELSPALPAAARLVVAGLPVSVLPYLTTAGTAPDDQAANQPAMPLLLVGAIDPPLAPFALEAEIRAAYLPGDVLLWLHPGPESLPSLARLRHDLPDLILLLGPDPAHIRLVSHFARANHMDAPPESTGTGGPSGEQPGVFWAVWQPALYTDSAGDDVPAPHQVEAQLIRYAVCTAAHNRFIGSGAASAPAMQPAELLAESPAELSTVVSEAPARWRFRLLPLAPDTSFE